MTSAEKRMLKALGLLEAEKHQEALDILAGVLADDPDETTALDLFIEGHMQLGRYERVIELADARLVRENTNGRILVWKARALKELGRIDEVATAALAAARLEFDHSDDLVLLSDILFANHRFDDAITVCHTYLSRHPDAENVSLQRVNLFALAEKNQQLLESSGDHIRRFGKSAHVLSLMANAHVAMGRLSMAKRKLREAAVLEPDEMERHAGIVMFDLLYGDQREAERYLVGLARRDRALAERVRAACLDTLDDASQSQ